VLTGRATNAYALIRPPGHHAEPDKAMGFCFLNNVAIAARYAQAKYSVRKVAIVDFDVHHGNGTQKIFWEDPSVLFISIHQDSNYPIGTGLATERGEGPGHGFTINVPLPPGSGRGAYAAVTDQVVVPALDAFIPDLILASSGFDASFLDPLSSMMASSEDFRNITHKLVTAAAKHCAGRLIFMHEGGYSEVYVPYCGLAVVEALSGLDSGVKDPMLEDVYNRGYQELQAHQDLVIQRSAAFVKDIAP
jgi:acetoin utilization deacetylase AcuC-like enzyme